MRYQPLFGAVLCSMCLTFAAGPEKAAVEGSVRIPASAAIVCQSPRGGERSISGFPATEIFVAGPEGQNPTRITHQRKTYNHVAVSPDKRYIAAGRYDEGDSNRDGKLNTKDRKVLVVLDTEEKQEWKPVPNADDACMGGVDWTPDSKYIVAPMRFGRRIDIYRVRPDGTGLQNLTENLPRLLGSSRPVAVTDVSVSSDGKWIVFVATSRVGENTRLVVSRIDGSEARYVTDGGGAEARNARSQWAVGDFDPEFSPDGQYISFQRSTQTAVGPGGFPSYDIVRVRIDGTDLRRLTKPGERAVKGVSDWSADNKILFSQWSPVGGFTGPIVVNPDGSGYHQLDQLRGCTWARWVPSN